MNYLLMSIRFSYVLIIILFINACTNTDKQPVVEPNQILKNAISFWTYKQKYLQLYEDYQAFDKQQKPIPKEAFLRALATGSYLPLRLKSADTTTVYQLYPLPEKVDKDLKAVLRQWAHSEYAYYLVEGKPLPDYHFVDMHGNVYTKQSTKGKILVLKCWFVHCMACVAEMPALNELKQRYKHRDDVLFVSLCLDPSDKVAAFLKKTRFDYATVPAQTDYLEDTLKINAYPMHLVINKEGLIIKQVDNYQGLAYTLDQVP